MSDSTCNNCLEAFIVNDDPPRLVCLLRPRRVAVSELHACSSHSRDRLAEKALLALLAGGRIDPAELLGDDSGGSSEKWHRAKVVDLAFALADEFNRRRAESWRR